MQVVKVLWGHLLSPAVPRDPWAPQSQEAGTSGTFQHVFTNSASHLGVLSMWCQTSGLTFKKKIKTDLLDVLALCRQEFNFLIVISLLSWDSQSASNSAKEKGDKVLCFFSSDGLSQQTYVHMITENWTILLLLYFPSGYLHDIKLSAQLLYCFGDIRTILNQWFDYFAFSLSDEIDQNNMVCWSWMFWIHLKRTGIVMLLARVYGMVLF